MAPELAGDIAHAHAHAHTRTTHTRTHTHTHMRHPTQFALLASVRASTVISSMQSEWASDTLIAMPGMGAFPSRLPRQRRKVPRSLAGWTHPQRPSPASSSQVAVLAWAHCPVLPQRVLAGE